MDEGVDNHAKKDKLLCCANKDIQHHDHCQVHGLLKLLDETLGVDQASERYAAIPVPKQVRVRRSSIKDAGLGVFATEFIPKNTKMGPYKGVILQEDEITPDADCSYLWEIKQASGASFYVDGKDEKEANWLRFVNCARHDEEQNLEAFQCCNNIYYLSHQDIYPGTELLTWYGTEFATKNLGLSLDCSTESHNNHSTAASITLEKENLLPHSTSEDGVIKLSSDDNNATIQKCLQCKRCGKSFPTHHHLTRHKKEHLHEKRYHCWYCNKAFSNNYFLKKHVDFHIKQKTRNSKPVSAFKLTNVSSSAISKQYKCEYCSKSFAKRFLLLVHRRMHKSFQCLHCSKSFVTAYLLKIHSKVHVGERHYKCQHCSRSFSYNKSFKKHVEMHTSQQQSRKLFSEQVHEGNDSKLYQCQHCYKSFGTNWYLKIHARVHSGEKPYNCQHCNKSFYYQNSFKRHTELHTRQSQRISTTNVKHLEVLSVLNKPGIKPYKCQHCSMSFTRACYLTLHTKVHTGLRPYQCQHCDKSFTTRSVLKVHSTKHTRARQYQYRRKSSQCFERNVVLHSRQKQPKKLSFKQISNDNSMKNHSTIDTSGSKPFQCHYCSKSFNTNSYLKVHTRTHTGERPYKCQHCNKSFCYSSSFKRHNAMHASRQQSVETVSKQSPSDYDNDAQAEIDYTDEVSDSKLYQCQHCYKFFSTRFVLKAHSRIHTGKKSFQCQQCSKSFSYKHCLKRHIEMHSRKNQSSSKQALFEDEKFVQVHSVNGLMPYQCHHCSKSFRTRAVLTIHIRKHTGERPFACQYCNKSFPTNSYLKIHTRIHTGERPYKCQQCNKSFSYHNCLTRHLEMHGRQIQLNSKQGLSKVDKCVKIHAMHEESDSKPGLLTPKAHSRICTGEKPFHCQHHSKSFSYKRCHETHPELHNIHNQSVSKQGDSEFVKFPRVTDGKPFKCQHCSMSFTRACFLKIHLRVHTGLTPYQCQHCSKSFTKRSILRVHIRKHTRESNYHRMYARRHAGERPYNCQHCMKTFSYRHCLRRHNKLHIAEKLFQGPQHSKAEHGQDLDDKHNEACMKTGVTMKTKHQCHYCKKYLPHRTRLKEHIRSHTGERPYKCQQCDKSFAYAYSFKKHATLHEQELDDKRDEACIKTGVIKITKHQCHFCKRYFPFSARLKEHIRSHTGERPYKCQQCGKSFAYVYSFTKHSRKHAIEKKFNCHNCGMIFDTNDRLAEHMKMHDKVEVKEHKSYSCPYCYKLFFKIGCLYNHISLHTGENPHRCQYCGKSFVYSKSLTKHLRTHTQAGFYQCPLCIRVLSNIGSLQKHLTTHMQ